VRESANKVGLKNIKVGKKEISFEYNIQGALKNKRLRAMLVLDKCITKVKRGENSNKILQNSNIIVEDSSITIDEVNGSAEISIPKIVNATDKLNLIALVENLDYDITGATKQSLVR
jgi:hypothetical protein